MRCTDQRDVCATLSCGRCGVWPGVRRAGLSEAEPGADAGPAAPRSGAALKRARYGYAPHTWSARPGKCCSVRPSPGRVGGSSASPT